MAPRCVSRSRRSRSASTPSTSAASAARCAWRRGRGLCADGWLAFAVLCCLWDSRWRAGRHAATRSGSSSTSQQRDCGARVAADAERACRRRRCYPRCQRPAAAWLVSGPGFSEACTPRSSAVPRPSAARRRGLFLRCGVACRPRLLSLLPPAAAAASHCVAVRHEAPGGRHLEVQGLQQDPGWRRVCAQVRLTECGGRGGSGVAAARRQRTWRAAQLADERNAYEQGRAASQGCGSRADAARAGRFVQQGVCAWLPTLSPDAGLLSSPPCSTAASVTVRSTIRRLREQIEK